MGEYGKDFHGLPDLWHVRDLEWFEGPILTELKAKSEDSESIYVQKWCAFKDNVVRNVVVRSDARSIALYMSKRMSMLELLTRPNLDVGFLIDRYGTQLRGVQLVQVSDLPPQYLPDPTAMHDESLRPPWSTVPHTFLVDDDWDPRLFYELEREYRNAYAFTYFLRSETPRAVPMPALNYVLEGYGYGDMFAAVRGAVPKNDNAKTSVQAAASPGVLMLAAPSGVASDLEESIRAVASPETRKAYSVLYQWSRLPEESAQDIPQAAFENYRRLAALLLVDPDRLLPGPGFDKKRILRAGKVMASYYRMLRRVLRPRRGAEFLAPGLEDDDDVASAAVDEQEHADESTEDDEPDAEPADDIEDDDEDDDPESA